MKKVTFVTYGKYSFVAQTWAKILKFCSKFRTGTFCLECTEDQQICLNQEKDLKNEE